MQYKNTREKWTKSCISFPKKGDPGIIRNNRSITLTASAAKVYNALLLNWKVYNTLLLNWKVYNTLLLNRTRSWENSKEKSDWLLEKSIYNVTDFDYPSNHWRRTCKKKKKKQTPGKTFVYRFLQGIWFHSQRKDEANASSIWSPQRNYYCYNHVLQKNKVKVR